MTVVEDRAPRQSFTCAFDDFPDSPGRGWQHGGLVETHTAHVHHVEAIHVFAGTHGVADATLVNVRWEK